MTIIKRNNLQWDNSAYRLSIYPIIQRIGYQWINSSYKCDLALNILATEI